MFLKIWIDLAVDALNGAINMLVAALSSKAFWIFAAVASVIIGMLFLYSGKTPDEFFSWDNIRMGFGILSEEGVRAPSAGGGTPADGVAPDVGVGVPDQGVPVDDGGMRDVPGVPPVR